MASIEAEHYQGDHSLLAFLDCSKCYERVGHALAGRRALRSGLAARVANMLFDMYKGRRHVKVARPKTGGHGLVAGCAFAKDILKAFLVPINEECPRGKPWDYVDGITGGIAPMAALCHDYAGGAGAAQSSGSKRH